MGRPGHPGPSSPSPARPWRMPVACALVSQPGEGEGRGREAPPPQAPRTGPRPRPRSEPSRRVHARRTSQGRGQGGREGQEGRGSAASAAHKTVLRIDVAAAGGAHPLVPRPPVRLRWRRRLRHPCPVPVRSATSPAPDAGEPVLDVNAWPCTTRCRWSWAEQPGPFPPRKKGAQAARPRGGGGHDRATPTSGGVVVRLVGAARSRWSAARATGTSRARAWSRCSWVFVHDLHRDPPRLVPLQHPPGDGGRPGDRDVDRSLVTSRRPSRRCGRTSGRR